MSKLQELARKRNFAKMRLCGTLVTFTDLINSNIVTGRESNEIKKIIKSIKVIEKDWDKEWNFLKAVKIISNRVTKSGCKFV